MAQRGVSAVICGIFVCLTVLFTSNSAYAAVIDTDDCEQWFNNNDFDTAQIQSNDLSGCLRFFYAQNSLYCCLSYSIDNMSGNEDISVEINISNINRSYTFLFSDNDDCDYPCKLTKHFTQLTNLGQDIYFMLEFTDKEDKNTDNCAVINLIVNTETSYNIAKIDMLTDIQDSEQNYTAFVEETESKQTESEQKQDKEETTKFVYSKDGKNEEAKTESATKFSSNSDYNLNNNNEQESSYNIVSPKTQGDSDSALVDVPTQKKTSFSTPAKAMLALSGAFALTGAGVLIRGAVKRKLKAEQNHKDEKSENEE